MTKWMGLAAAVALGAGVAAFSGGAQARILCNEEGDCWHTHEGFEILPGLHLEEHPDDWRMADDHRHHWHEHEGRGYWDHGEWRGL